MKRLALLSIALLAATPALAHPGHGGGFFAGFAHPMTGLDHVLAMVAVGLWAAMRGGRAIWAWPATFVAAMAAGFALTQGGLVVPQVETMIVASVMLLGAAIALGIHAPVIAGVAALTLFGVAHGAAHGMELHGQPVPFAAGFMGASLLLHAAGFGIAAVFGHLASRWPARIAGVGMVAAGAAIALKMA